MSRFCLRYKSMDLGLGERELVVGRDFDCDLVLDDALVSRRHAIFREHGTDGEVEVEDLGSRNGVLVNDARIAGPTRLRHGDRVKIGSQQLVVKDLWRIKPRAGTSELSRCATCAEFVPAEAERCDACGARLTPAAGSSPSLPPASAENPSQRPAGAFAVLAQLVDKALGLGRLDEAERVLQNMVSTLLTGMRTPGEPAGGSERASLAMATGYALRLAEALQKPSWLDSPFEMYAATAQLMPADLIDELYRIANKLHYTNPRPIRAYMARVKADAANLGPADRFLLQRLEGLERRMVNG